MAFPDYEVEEYIQNTDKCKLEGKISHIKNLWEGPGWCSSDLEVFVNNQNKTYKFKTEKVTWKCDLDSFSYLIDKNDKIWNFVYILADKEYDYKVLKIDKKNYDKYPEVPLCTDNIVELPQENYLENKFIWWWIIIVILIIWVIFYKIKRNKKQS